MRPQVTVITIVSVARRICVSVTTVQSYINKYPRHYKIFLKINKVRKPIIVEGRERPVCSYSSVLRHPRASSSTSGWSSSDCTNVPFFDHNCNPSPLVVTLATTSTQPYWLPALHPR